MARMTPVPPPSSRPAGTVPDVSSSKGEGQPVEKTEVIPEVDKTEEREDEKEWNDSLPEDLGEEVALLTPPPAPPRLEAPKEILLLPDLTITNLFLDPKKRLAVTIANVGNSPLPMGFGNLKIFMDGQLKRSYELNNLTDQSFLEPKENITFTTSLTVRGRREVQARVETS